VDSTKSVLIGLVSRHQRAAAASNRSALPIDLSALSYSALLIDGQKTDINWL
jgi:hypothetical protein